MNPPLANVHRNPRFHGGAVRRSHVTLADRLRARIEADGPMPFEDWMEACLYDPDEGYYMQARKKTGTGDDADFATSPKLHPFLAQCVAREAEGLWEALGRPTNFRIAEFGGGEGDLARDAQAWLAQHSALSCEWIHIEISPDHRQKQGGGQAEALPDGFVGLVVAHEFVDALPFQVLRRTDGGWESLHVGDGEVWQPIEFGGPTVRPGTRMEWMHRAWGWLRDVAGMAAGSVLVIDYGREGPSQDSLRTFAKQQDAGSALEGPGTKDITANVDFRQLRAWADEAGFVAPESQSQEEWLLEHGILDELNRIGRDDLDDASSYLRLRQLLLPTAMGQAFRVARFGKRTG